MKQKYFATIFLLFATTTVSFAEQVTTVTTTEPSKQNITGQPETVIIDANGNLTVVPKTGTTTKTITTGGPGAQPNNVTQTPPPPSLYKPTPTSNTSTQQIPESKSPPPAATTGTYASPARSTLGQPEEPAGSNSSTPGTTLQSIPRATESLQPPTPVQTAPIGQSQLPGFDQAPRAAAPPFNQTPVKLAPVPPKPTSQSGSQTSNNLQENQQTAMAHYSASETSAHSELINGEDNIPS